ncbi:MAG: DUF3575 domain-containing protein [Bacteroidales bacterium]|nr:DUF3575 domain-containing protein [Bacteroidales bacterium]
MVIARWILKLIIFFISLSISTVNAQRLSLKTNALYWLTLSPNLSLEAVVSSHSTVGLSGAFNAWTIGSLPSIKFAMVQGDYRYWFRAPMSGHFIGGTLLYSYINPTFNCVRREGYAAGIGPTYGYAWILGKHWNLEAYIGFGYLYTKYSRYDHGLYEGVQYKHLFAPLSIGATVSYILK